MKRVNISKVLVRRADGKYLILRGSKWEERPDRSQKPDLPGGMVEDGETHKVGGARELMEEAGISVKPGQLELVHAESFIWKEDEAVTRLIYLVRLENPEVTLSWEHEGFWWMNKQEVLGLEIRKPYPEIFGYLDKIGVLV